MSEENEKSGGVTRVLGKLGLWNTPEAPDPGPDARPLPNPAPAVASPATHEALTRLRNDIGLDDPASPFHVFEGILGTLEDAIPDAAVRYKKALQLAERQMVGRESILQEFDELHATLKQQSDILEATLADMGHKKLDPKLQHEADIEAALKARRAEVARLEEELAQAKAAVKAEADAMDGIRANFAAARNTVIAELQTMERSFRENLGIKE